MVTQFTQKKGKAVYISLRLIIELYLSKRNLPCDKACDIVIPMHFYVHKNKIF